jgi:hypothetical protein
MRPLGTCKRLFVRKENSYQRGLSRKPAKIQLNFGFIIRESRLAFAGSRFAPNKVGRRAALGGRTADRTTLDCCYSEALMVWLLFLVSRKGPPMMILVSVVAAYLLFADYGPPWHWSWGRE